jgi:hypothetical protein
MEKFHTGLLSAEYGQIVLLVTAIVAARAADLMKPTRRPAFLDSAARQSAPPA